MTGACGTTAGYNRHQKKKTITCGPCLQARSVYMRARGITSGRTTTASLRLETLAVLLRGSAGPILRNELGDVVCDAILGKFPQRGSA